MGSLVDDKARLTLLFAGHLFGRAEHCETRVDSAYASSEHAKIQWNGRAWTLRDLGSRNGTFLDGTRIEPALSVHIRRGSSVGFGDPGAPWRMVDDSPPVAMAIPRDGGVAVVETDGMLVLSTRGGGITVRRALDHWLLDRRGAVDRVVDGAHVEAEGKSYALVLPQIAPETTPLEASHARLEPRARLLIKTSANEEHVEIRLNLQGRLHDLGTREHNYLLLYLARRRLADQTASLSAEAVGWVYPEEVCHDLCMDRGRLNVDVYRIRKQFSMLEPIPIIERRGGTRELRIGLADISLTAV